MLHVVDLDAAVSDNFSNNRHLLREMTTLVTPSSDWVYTGSTRNPPQNWTVFNAR